MPNFVSELNIPALNIINIAFISCVISLIMYRVKSDYQLFSIPKQYIFIFFIINVLLFIGAFNYNENIYSNIFQSLVSNYFKQVIIISIYIFIFNYCKQFDASFFYKIYSYFILIILISFFIDKIIYGISLKEYAGFLGTGNTVGNYLVASLPITIFIKDYYLKGNINKIIPILIILAVMMSNSRGSILALIIICILYFIIFLKVSHITKIVYGSIFFGIGTIIISQSPYYYSLIEYFDTAPILLYEHWNDTELLIDSSGRSTIWSNLFLFLEQNNYMLFGAGIDNFLKISDYNTQNHLFKIIADYGFVFTSILLCIYIYIIFALLSFKSKIANQKISDYIKLFLLSIVGLSVVGFFSHYTIGSDIMSIYWVQFGLFLFYVQESKRTYKTS